MKTIITALVFLAALAASDSQARAANNDSPETVVRAVNAVFAEMTTAAESLNADALFAHVAEMENGAIAVNGQTYATRAEALVRTRQNFAGLRSLKYAVVNQPVTVLSPTSALMVTTLTTRGETADGRSFSGASVLSIVFVFRNGVWKVIHSHQSTPPQN